MRALLPQRQLLAVWEDFSEQALGWINGGFSAPNEKDSASAPPLRHGRVLDFGFFEHFSYVRNKKSVPLEGDGFNL